MYSYIYFRYFWYYKSRNSWWFKKVTLIDLVKLKNTLIRIWDFYKTVETFISVFRFLKYNPKDVNKCHQFGWAPIHVAAVNNKHEQIEVLIKNGADPNISEGFSNSFHTSKKLRFNPVDGKIKRILINNFFYIC